MPDGYLAHLYGLIVRSCHDLYSNLLPQLHALMPAGQGTIYPAYPMSAYLYRGVTQPAPGSIEAPWNKKMATAQITVEWTFREVSCQFQQLNLKQTLVMYKFPVTKYYAVAVFLVICWNSCYCGETASYFTCEPMSLEEYIGLLNWNC
jgi:hypothetical protein